MDMINTTFGRHWRVNSNISQAYLELFQPSQQMLLKGGARTLSKAFVNTYCVHPQVYISIIWILQLSSSWQIAIQNASNHDTDAELIYNSLA